MDVSVDSSKCQGHMRCVDIAPSLFAVDDDGFAVADHVPVIGEEARALALRARDNCPEAAVVINDV